MKYLKFSGAIAAATFAFFLQASHTLAIAQTPTPHGPLWVQFPPGGASLTPSARSALQSLAQDIGDVPVAVVARADALSADADTLAMARAKMTAAVLRSSGVTRSKLSVQIAPPLANAPGPVNGVEVDWTPGVGLAVAVIPSAGGDGHQDMIPIQRMAAVAEHQGTSLDRWEVKTSDVTLLRTLERWALTAGMKLKWDAAKNFLIDAPDTYTGTLEQALHAVLSSPGIRLSDYPLEACFYANTPPLVRVTRQGLQATECSAVEASAP